MPSPLQCPQCGPFPQNSVYYDHEYHTSVPLQRLCASNLLGTEEEIAHVQNFLSNIHCDRTCLEGRFTILSRVVASMKEECGALRTLETKYERLVSARRAVPHELWSNIFLYAQSDDQDFDSLNPSGIIWQLSHVCQAWRDVALCLDSFWSRITLKMFFSTDKYEKTVHILQLVLSRSKLLDVNLQRTDAFANPVRDRIRDRILDVVLSQSHRWRSAYLVDDAFGSDGLFAPLRGRLPQLRFLNLRTYYYNVQVQLFEDCPLLTKVALSSCAVTLPLSQIAELQIGPSWYEGITRASLMLIRQCPLLQVLRIYIHPDEDEQAVITTPSIHKLETNSGPIIDNLVLPLVRDATLSEPLPSDIHPRRRWHVLQSFRQFLRRSDCTSTFTRLKIVHLSLGWYDLGSCPLFPVLAETTRLAVLELDLRLTSDYGSVYRVREMEHVAELMRALQITGRNILLPCLSSLKAVIASDVDPCQMPFLAPPGSNCAWGDFPAMLKARWEGDEALGLSRLHTYHVALTNRVWDTSHWEDGKWIPRSLWRSPEEHAIVKGLVEASMNLDIQVTFLEGYTEFTGRRKVSFSLTSVIDNGLSS